MHSSRKALLVTLGIVALAAGCTRTPAPQPVAAVSGPEFGDAFWKQWGDGRGELAGYDLEIPRYGALRHGTAVTIFVTETFSNKRRVKADPGRHPKTDEFPVMKLNLVQDFGTGIYDYNLMTSAFTALASVNARPSGSPTKVSFSAQEWCGQVYAQVLFDARYARFVAHSYFDTEADSTSSFELPNDALSEDALLAWARGFTAPVLARGDSAEAPLLGSLREARLLHQPLVTSQAHFKRAAATESVVVPAGTFDADVYSVVRPRRPHVDVLGRIERPAPRRDVVLQRRRTRNATGQRPPRLLEAERPRRRAVPHETRPLSASASHTVRRHFISTKRCISVLPGTVMRTKYKPGPSFEPGIEDQLTEWRPGAYVPSASTSSSRP